MIRKILNLKICQVVKTKFLFGQRSLRAKPRLGMLNNLSSIFSLTMRGLLSGLVLLPLTFAEAEPEPAYSPFFPRLSPEALEILGVGPDPSPEPRETFLDECSKHTTCGDCATASSFFTSCRWCPKFGDVSCHVVGSLSNTCESDEQVRRRSKGAVKPTARY